MRKAPVFIKTTVFNKDEFLEFKERRRFQSLKDAGHYYFDKLWAEAKLFTREEAYKWLADKLGVPEEHAHFRRMPKTLYKDAIYFCQQLLNDNRRFDLDFGGSPITPLYDISQWADR